MRNLINSFRPARPVTAALLGAAAFAAAGCSSEVTRFSQPLFGGSGEPQYTGSVNPAPSGGVERTDLADASVERSNLAAAPAVSSWPVATPSSSSASGSGRVTVGQGDTVNSIARRYGVPEDALMRVNGISDANAMRPGQELIIPVYSSATGSWQPPRQDNGQTRTAQRDPEPSAPASAQRQSGGTHTVGQGETVFSIARAYQANPNEIIRANGLDSPDRLRVGQSLTIPGGNGGTTPARDSQPIEQATSAPTPPPEPREEEPTRTAAAEQPDPAPAAYAPTTGDDSESDTRAGLAEPQALSAGKFRWPVRGRVISSFGDASDGGRNDGVNISVPEGTSVRAAENGVVAYAGDELQGFGNLVLIRHADDWVSAYAHNSELMVSRGDQVTRGQVIARAGQSGSVNSPQVHFELRRGAQPVDPLGYLAEN